MNENITAYSAKFFSHIPKDWKLEPLKTLVNSDRKITYGIVQPGTHDSEGVLLIRGQDYMNGWVDKTKFFRVSPDLHKKFKRSTTTAGDVLLSIAGYTGTVAVVPDWIKEANLTQTTARIACDDDKLVGPYLSYFLQGDDGQLQSKRYTKGSAQEGLNLEDIERFVVCFPPLREQQKIAAILSSVDDVIEKTRAQIDKLKDLKTGMKQEVLTKGIGHTEFKDSPLGRIPEAWAVLPLSELVSRDRPITYGIVQTGENLPKGIPCVRVLDLMRPALSTRDMIRTSEKISHQYKRTLLKEGDIMFALRGEIGHVRLTDESLVGANLTRGVALISPNNTIMPRYLLWALRSPVVRSIIMDGVNGSALQEIPLGNLRNVLIPVPPEEEQARLADTLDALEQSKTQSERKLDTYRNLKKALMQDLLTGKVRVKVDQKESAVA